MNKTQLNLSSIFGLIVSVVFIWVFVFSVWYANNINDKEKFVATTNQVLTSEVSRNAMSNEIIDRVTERRPVLGSVTAPLLTKVIAGLMDTQLFGSAVNKASEELHLQLTAKDPKPLTINVKAVKDLVNQLVSEENPELFQNVPDVLTILRRNQIPSLYQFGTALTILGPLLLIVGLIVSAFVWMRTENKRGYLIYLGLIASASGLLAYFLIQAGGDYLRSLANTVNASTLINELYLAFTKPLSEFSICVFAAGLIGALLSKFLKRDLFKLSSGK